ncbi:MAG: hypothetical protein MHM6MM_002002 [Cercozoa sp. M6MM]
MLSQMRPFSLAAASGVQPLQLPKQQAQARLWQWQPRKRRKLNSPVVVHKVSVCGVVVSSSQKPKYDDMVLDDGTAQIRCIRWKAQKDDYSQEWPLIGHAVRTEGVLQSYVHCTQVVVQHYVRVDATAEAHHAAKAALLALKLCPHDKEDTDFRPSASLPDPFFSQLDEQSFASMALDVSMCSPVDRCLFGFSETSVEAAILGVLRQKADTSPATPFDQLCRHDDVRSAVVRNHTSRTQSQLTDRLLRMFAQHALVRLCGRGAVRCVSASDDTYAPLKVSDVAHVLLERAKLLAPAPCSIEVFRECVLRHFPAVSTRTFHHAIRALIAEKQLRTEKRRGRTLFVLEKPAS